MMTSSNGNISRVTGPLCWEFTGHRWIPRTKARLSKQSWGWQFETPLHSLWRDRNEIAIRNPSTLGFFDVIIAWIFSVLKHWFLLTKGQLWETSMLLLTLLPFPASCGTVVLLVFETPWRSCDVTNVCNLILMIPIKLNHIYDFIIQLLDHNRQVTLKPY